VTEISWPRRMLVRSRRDKIRNEVNRKDLGQEFTFTLLAYLLRQNRERKADVIWARNEDGRQQSTDITWRYTVK